MGEREARDQPAGWSLTSKPGYLTNSLEDATFRHVGTGKVGVIALFAAAITARRENPPRPSELILRTMHPARGPL